MISNKSTTGALNEAPDGSGNGNNGAQAGNGNGGTKMCPIDNPACEACE